jgi:polyphosphate kinase 2 (PPK2 family)
MTTKIEIDDVQMEKLRMDLLDSLDEEIETELEDRDDVAAMLLRQEHRSERLTYFRELLRLQSELVKLQDWVVAHKHRVVVLFEGRDAAGKGGVIKRITQR